MGGEGDGKERGMGGMLGEVRGTGRGKEQKKKGKMDRW